MPRVHRLHKEEKRFICHQLQGRRLAARPENSTDTIKLRVQKSSRLTQA
jgi:hypothetical protein